MPLPEMKPVISSNISDIGHDPDKQELYVRFKGGAVFKYAGVSKDAHNDLVNAESIGSHFHKHVRNAYQFAKHDE